MAVYAEREDTVTLTIINEAKGYGSEADSSQRLQMQCDTCGRGLPLSISRKAVSLDCPSIDCSGRMRASSPSRVGFTCFLSFQAKREDTYIPPFLPVFRFSIASENYARMIDQVADIEVALARFYPDKKRRVLDAIQAVGEQVATMDRNLQETFDYILESTYDSFVIFTNDASLPWHWSYSPKQRVFVLDRYPCGTIFVDRVEDTLTRFRKLRNRTLNPRQVFTSRQEALRGHSVIMLHPDPAGCADDKLAYARKEKERILSLLTVPQDPDDPAVFSAENIYCIPAPSDSKWSEFSPREQIAAITAQEAVRKGLEIIHFTGHIKSAVGRDELNNECEIPVLQLGPNEDSCIRADDIQGAYLESEPLVFLNGCSSGHISDLWNKSASLATALLNRGAAGCVVTTGSVFDRSGFELAEYFYSSLLQCPESLTFGKALLAARRQMAMLDQDDPMRLMFHFYGDPGGRLIYTSPPDSALELICGTTLQEDAEDR